LSRYLPASLLAFWAALVLGILLSMAFIDQPLALFFWPCQGLRPAFNICAAPSLLALPLSGLYLAWLVLQRLRGRSPQNPLWLSVAIATIAATAAKDELKWIFGRSWPQFWLKDGLYGFQPFSNSFFYGSFPSGHTAYISAPLAVLWALRPQWRPACAGLTLLVMFGLVAADYHYFADVLAGLLTGTGCAWATLVLLKPPHVL
jgi:membrane-associated phospholipid phosphatase